MIVNWVCSSVFATSREFTYRIENNKMKVKMIDPVNQNAYCRLYKLNRHKDDYINIYPWFPHRFAPKPIPCEFKCEQGITLSYVDLPHKQQYVSVIVSNNKDDFTRSPQIIVGLSTRKFLYETTNNTQSFSTLVLSSIYHFKSSLL